MVSVIPVSRAASLVCLFSHREHIDRNQSEAATLSCGRSLHEYITCQEGNRPKTRSCRGCLFERSKGGVAAATVITTVSGLSACAASIIAQTADVQALVD